MKHSLIKTVPLNQQGRDFVVGDLHGCFEELGKLLNYVQFKPGIDRLFSTGDLVDRGPNPIGCLSLLNRSWFYPVMGNHEELLITQLKMLLNGQAHSFTENELEFLIKVKNYINKLIELPYIYEIPNAIFGNIYIVHAEILPEHLMDLDVSALEDSQYNILFNTLTQNDFSDKIQKFIQKYKDLDMDKSLKNKLIWSRKIITSFYKNNKREIDKGDFLFLKKNSFSQKTKVFCGHNVVPFPMKISQQYYIDTGAALGYQSLENSSNLFTQFGHEFFALSMTDLTSGACYGCITSQEQRGKIVKLEKPIYDYEELML